MFFHYGWQRGSCGDAVHGVSHDESGSYSALLGQTGAKADVMNAVATVAFLTELLKILDPRPVLTPLC